MLPLEHGVFARELLQSSGNNCLFFGQYLPPEGLASGKNRLTQMSKLREGIKREGRRFSFNIFITTAVQSRIE
jgi:hypothetical protein